MNLSPLFRHSLKHPCLSCRQLSFCPVSKIYPRLASTYSISTSNFLLKRLKWLNSPTNAMTKISSTISANVATFWVSRKTWRIQTTPRPSYIIYFKRSLSTSALTFPEPAPTMTITPRCGVEVETALATSRMRRRRMAQPKILVLISLK